MNGKGMLIWFSKFSKFPTLAKLIKKRSRFPERLSLGSERNFVFFLLPALFFFNSFLVHNALQNNEQTHDNYNNNSNNNNNNNNFFKFV